MKSITTHYGTLTDIRRLPSSQYGNPRFTAHCAGFSFRTAPDSQLAYSLRNFEGKRVKVQIGTYYGKATLHAIEEEIDPNDVYTEDDYLRDRKIGESLRDQAKEEKDPALAKELDRQSRNVLSSALRNFNRGYRRS